MRIAYFGTSGFAATILRRLAAHEDGRYAPALAIAPPDRRQGRGRKLAAAPVAAAAAELGIEVLKTEATEGVAELARIREAADLGVVCAFGQILREPLLAELELLNVHPSLLPRWRGAAPIERTIMAGDELTGVTIIRVTEGLDSGPIALTEELAVGDDDYGHLAGRLEEAGARALIAALDRRAAGELELRPQDDSAATYAEKIDPAERRIDPARPAIELERLVRALTPHVGAYLELAEGERLGVVEALAEDGDLAPAALETDGGELRLGCGEGLLRLVRVRPAGGRPMDAAAYLRGHEPPALASS